jgi:hypothetical protein
VNAARYAAIAARRRHESTALDHATTSKPNRQSLAGENVMGNKPGIDKGKPLILGGVPSSSAVGAAYEATFVDQADHETATLTEGKTLNAYYLPWKNGTYTEGSFALNPSMEYFFTAQLTGCSLWVKTDKDHKKISFVHEARTDTNSQQIHQKDGFTLVVDSNAMKKAGFSQEAGFTIDKKNIKTMVHFEAYALLNYEHKVVEFRIQMIQTVQNLELRTPPSFKLLDVKTKTVALPL